jgi:steroid delta-isomerase
MRSWIWICGILLLAAPGARAETPDQAAIRAALTGWMADFNVGRHDRVCDLFSPELRYDYRGFPERGYRELCELLHRSLSKQEKKFAYAVDIREILVFGDLAIVRLTWTLKVTDMAPAAAATTEEPGLDVFRRRPTEAGRSSATWAMRNS